MDKVGEHNLSNPGNLNILKSLLDIQLVCLILASLLAAITLCGWLVPALGQILPHGWMLMKANTALCMLFCAISLMLHRPTHHKSSHAISEVCSLFTLLLANSALLAHWNGQPSWLETLLATDKQANMPGTMSVQSAIFFTLSAIVFPLNSANKQYHKVYTYLADVLLIVAFALVVIISMGYAFRLYALVGQSLDTLTAPQTVAGMILLMIALIIHRTRADGMFSILIGTGIGSQIARFASPIVILPFLTTLISAYWETRGWLPIFYAEAINTALFCVLLIIVLLWGGIRFNRLELNMLNMSMRDEMTQLYNYRGFQMIGEHLYSELQRSGNSLFVIYMDLDGLKQANDNYGHEIGSRLIVDFARLLRNNFRHSDLVARVGGDEFIILSHQGEPETALNRLNKAVAAFNQANKQPYQINYSVGITQSTCSPEESLEQLVSNADQAMYKNKQQKKIKRAKRLEPMPLD